MKPYGLEVKAGWLDSTLKDNRHGYRWSTLYRNKSKKEFKVAARREATKEIASQMKEIDG